MKKELAMAVAIVAAGLTAVYFYLESVEPLISLN